MVRRDFLGSAAGVLMSLFGMPKTASSGPAPRWRLPDEARPHDRTWMSFVARREIWGRDAPAVQDALGLIARTISRFEPVTVVVGSEDRADAQEACGDRVEYVELELDDFWIRDTGPVFVLDEQGRLGTVDLNFNGWGEKQRHSLDAMVARHVADSVQAPVVAAPFVGEGGGLEVDGSGTAILTESCWLNENRNPGMSRIELELYLRSVFGIEKAIWLPGVRGQDITDGHTDFYARFARPGVVVAALENDPSLDDYDLTREHLRILRGSTDAYGAPIEVIPLEAPHSIRGAYSHADFAAGYINYYLANGVVVVPEFGDRERDRAAQEVLGRLFPAREVVALNIDVIASGGGGIHCATQQQPRQGPVAHLERSKQGRRSIAGIAGVGDLRAGFPAGLRGSRPGHLDTHFDSWETTGASLDTPTTS